MLRTALSIMLLSGLAAGVAHAQAWQPVVPESGDEPTVLPIWNSASGRMEGLLLVDSQNQPRSPVERVIGPANPRRDVPLASLRTAQGSRVDLSAGLEAQHGLALLCDGGGSMLTSLGALADHCLLADLGARDPLNAYSPGVRAGVGVDVGDFRFDLGGSMSRGDFNPYPDDVPVWLQPSASLLPGTWYGTTRLEHEGIDAGGIYRFGSDGWVSVGGSVARARLVPAQEALVGPLDWTGSRLQLGVGYGNFSGEIVGRSIDLPGGEPGWSGLDIGVSWRTPWQGRLTFGTQNVISRGRSPWVVDADAAEDGQRTPYVRYQQDL